MKFTDGYWQLRPGVTPLYPVHVHDVEMIGASRVSLRLATFFAVAYAVSVVPSASVSCSCAGCSTANPSRLRQ